MCFTMTNNITKENFANVIRLWGCLGPSLNEIQAYFSSVSINEVTTKAFDGVLQLPIGPMW